MPKIELWEKTGKGAIKFLHNIKRPLEVVALENSDGNLFPIYENHDTVPTGIYQVVQIRPYPKKGEEVFNRSNRSVEAWNEGDVIHLVREGYFIGGYIMSYQEKNWEKYLKSNVDKLERPIGWFAKSAQRMLLEVRKH